MHLLDNENLAYKVGRLAHFAWKNFPGVLSDYRLEKTLGNISKKIFSSSGATKIQSRVSAKRKVLHIASELYAIGGHTRVLRNWMLLDDDSDHWLMLNRGDSEIPNDHLQYIDREKIKILECGTLLGKANEMRAFVLEGGFDFVILHIHPDDVIPNIALSDIRNVRVLFYNHSDHSFSLGTLIADAIIDFRHVGHEYSRIYRNAYQTFYLPFPLEKRAKEIKSIDLKEGVIKLVSMASPFKFKPVDKINFLVFFDDLVRTLENVKFHIIGIDEDVFEKYTGYQNTNPKLILHGKVSDPFDIIKDADYFIEPFPFGTGLGAFDVCRFGAYPIANWIDYSFYGATYSTILPSELVTDRPITESSYKAFILEELKTGKLKSKNQEKILEFIKNCHGSEWKKKIELIYHNSSKRKKTDKNQFSLVFRKDENDVRHAIFFSSSLNLKLIFAVKFLFGCISSLDKMVLLKYFIIAQIVEKDKLRIRNKILKIMFQ